MIRFKKSPVVFNEEDHSYFLGDKRLLGITGLIHSILGLGVYPDASDYMKGYTIPRAGSKGTAVHHAIQALDMFGVNEPLQTVSTTYFKGCENEKTVDVLWDVSNQLASYIRHRDIGGFTALANELTVSDNEKWASQIDNVWQYNKTQGIWLVDTKTNNIDLYPLCGYYNPNYFNNSVDALKEYLSWQLSIYAELFEAENPDLKVEGLACNWLREDRAEFWIIERKPAELVKELLSSDYMMTDNGAIYYHPDKSIFGVCERALVTKEPSVPVVPKDVVTYMADLIAKEKELKAKLEEAKHGLRMAMEQHGLKSWDSGLFKATISVDSERNTFDSAAFKKDYPELYAQYTKKKIVKGGFTIK